MKKTEGSPEDYLDSLQGTIKLIRSDEFKKVYDAAPATQRIAFDWRLKWLSVAHKHQVLPSGDWWSIWLLLAGRGAGKTRVAAEQIGWWAWSTPNSRWLVSAPTSADVRSTCYEGDSGLLSVIPKELIADYNKSYHELKLINGSLIKGVPSSEPERFRGGQYHGAWLDELAAWEYLREAWDMIMFSVRLGDRTRILATTTPKPKELIMELIARDGDNVVVTTASTYSNIDNLAPSFREQILSYEGTKIGRQEIYAEIIDPEEGGIINRDWFRLWPAERAFPEFEYVLQSYDTAFTERTTGDPTACSVWGIFKPLDRPLCAMLLDCWSEHLAYPDLKPKLLEDYTAVYGEPGKRVDLVLIEEKASGQSLIQDLGRAHVQVQGYNPGKLDKVQRVHLISNIVSAGRVYLPESTKRKGYVRDWVEPFVQQVCAFPETSHDDYCVDENTLITMANGSLKIIKNVQIGDSVMTPKGARKVIAVHDNGIKEVWHARIGDSSLLATANHQIMTTEGWVNVDGLRQRVYSGYIHYGESTWRLIQVVYKLSRLCSMVANTTVIQKARTLRIANTLLGRVIDCTEMCGSFIMAQYQKKCIFITSMAILATTESKILSASRASSTILSTELNVKNLVSVQRKWLTLLTSEKVQRLGTSLKKGVHGIAIMLRNRWQKLGQILTYAKSLRQCVFGAAAKWLQRLELKSSVQQPAKVQNQRSVLVRDVTNTHIMRHVFDLTVEDEQCYYANGILVHNCDTMSQALRYLRDAGFLDIDPDPHYNDDDYIDDTRPKRINPYAA